MVGSARLKWLLPNGSPLPSPRLKPGASRGRLVNWVAYGWEHLSREAVRLRFSNAPRTDDFREWQDWLADLDPTEQADLQDLAHAEWATHGSEPLSLETVRRQFPGAPRTDRWPNGKSG